MKQRRRTALSPDLSILKCREVARLSDSAVCVRGMPRIKARGRLHVVDSVIPQPQAFASCASVLKMISHIDISRSDEPQAEWPTLVGVLGIAWLLHLITIVAAPMGYYMSPAPAFV